MSKADSNSNNRELENADITDNAASTPSSANDTQSMASIQMAVGMLQIYEPPLIKVRNHLKELIGKQNKIYIDLSTEKYKYDNVEIANLQEMMNNIKVYREKLTKIKKQMQAIYQKTKTLKKRANNIQACKAKELARKIQKQQQEEALIGKRNQNNIAPTQSPSSSTVTAPQNR